MQDCYCQLIPYTAGLDAIPQDLENLCAGELDQYSNQPWAYDWLKWEDTEAAITYVKERLFEGAAP